MHRFVTETCCGRDRSQVQGSPGCCVGGWYTRAMRVNMWKYFFATLLVLVISVCASDGFAQNPNTGIHVQIQPLVGNGRLCLDASGDHVGDGVPVLVYPCHGSDNQRWTISSSTGNEHAILGIGGFCLDVRGGNATGNGTPAELWKCHFGDNQRFALRPDGRIIEARSGKCLSVATPTQASAVVLNNCANVPQEVFAIRP